MDYHNPAAAQGPSRWALAITGVVAVLFGLATLFWPHITLLILVLLFGSFVLLCGAIEIAAMFTAIGAHETWWTHLLLGIIGIAAGLAVFLYPGVTVVVLAYMIGFWAVVIGIMEIVAAFVTGEFLLAIGGVIAVLFGLLLLANPGVGALAYVMVIGIFALVRGILLIIASLMAPSATPAA